MRSYRDSRLIRIILTSFFVAIIAYGSYEAQSIFFGPTITVPTEATTVHDPLTAITGTAERISELRLNGKRITVTEAGEFNEPYLLAEGSNHVALEARDARGRSAAKTLTIVYVPAPSEVPSE